MEGLGTMEEPGSEHLSVWVSADTGTNKNILLIHYQKPCIHGYESCHVLVQNPDGQS